MRSRSMLCIALAALFFTTAADKAIADVTKGWAAQSPTNRDLLAAVKDQIARTRASSGGGQ